MWEVTESKAARKALDGAPDEVQRNYDAWLQIVRLQGPRGLRAIKGFHDEALTGEWKGHRSSRLGIQFRLIYRVVASEQLFQVVSITAHDYRRP